ncbi:hypothetical protein AB0D49_03920 [Streptomyces sp. NPDC048290]|uniref:hypothetical protein n=1 Tax=Streptomyces sp. NPDC048290 TaxID=3155811 RepID=UPI00342167C8
MGGVKVRVVVGAGDGSDGRELVDAVRQLREMLLRRSVEDVVPEGGGAGPGHSKGGELVVAGTLVVTLVPQVITAVVAVVQAWSERAAGRSARLEFGDDSLEMTGLTARQQQELIDRFLARTDGSSGEDGGDGAA